MNYNDFLVNRAEIIVKKSRFISMLFNINNVNDVKLILDALKKEHKKAKHFPYAYKIGSEAKKSDDKEPSSTAGSPIYNIIEKNNLNNCLIVVIRYFGGVKLGSGGLIRAYSNAVKELIK